MYYNVHFQKISIPTPWKVIGNSFGEGVLKVKFLEAKYQAKLEFPRGRGDAKQKTFHGGGGGYGYFLKLHNHSDNNYNNDNVRNILTTKGITNVKLGKFH